MPARKGFDVPGTSKVPALAGSTKPMAGPSANVAAAQTERIFMVVLLSNAGGPKASQAAGARSLSLKKPEDVSPKARQLSVAAIMSRFR